MAGPSAYYDQFVKSWFWRRNTVRGGKTIAYAANKIAPTAAFPRPLGAYMQWCGYGQIPFPAAMSP